MANVSRRDPLRCVGRERAGAGRRSGNFGEPVPDDRQAPEGAPGVVIGDLLWRRRLGGDPAVLVPSDRLSSGQAVIQYQATNYRLTFSQQS